MFHRTSAERGVRLLWNDGKSSAYLISWPAGVGVEFHDHGVSVANIVVIGGEMMNRSSVGEWRRFATGQSIHVPAFDDHQLMNGSTSTATTVHVYVPPLEDERDLVEFVQYGLPPEHPWVGRSTEVELDPAA